MHSSFVLRYLYRTHVSHKLQSVVLIVALMMSSFAPFISFPQKAEAITCGAAGFTDIGSGVCRGYLTSSTSWTVPSDWNSSSNYIEVIGGGGGGAHGSGGGGAR